MNIEAYKRSIFALKDKRLETPQERYEYLLELREVKKKRDLLPFEEKDYLKLVGEFMMPPVTL